MILSSLLKIEWSPLQLTFLQIPKGATGLVQPWDVYGFRLWKSFVKHIEDYVLLHDIPLFFKPA